MLIYEITATVDAGVVAKYETYMLERHIPDLLATGYFSAAFFAKKDTMYRIGYHCNSLDDLEAYFAKDATRLRAHIAEHLPMGIELSRNDLDIIALFPDS